MSGPVDMATLATFSEMGFPPEDIRKALQQCSGNVSGALDYLTSLQDASPDADFSSSSDAASAEASPSGSPEPSEPRSIPSPRPNAIAAAAQWTDPQSSAGELLQLLQLKLERDLLPQVLELGDSDAAAAARVQRALGAKEGVLHAMVADLLVAAKEQIFTCILSQYAEPLSPGLSPVAGAARARQSAPADHAPASLDDRALAARLHMAEALLRKTMALGCYSETDAAGLVEGALEHVDPAEAGAEDVALEWILAQHNAPENASRGEVCLEDPILCVEVPISQMLTLNCCRSHTLAYETLYNCLKAADQHIPACPMANHPDEGERCNYTLTQDEAELILEGYQRCVEPFEEADLQRLQLEQGEVVRGGLGWVSRTFSALYLRKAKLDMGCIECPTPDCGTFVLPSGTGTGDEKECVHCLNCGLEFCSDCRRPHHYQSPCHEVMTLTRQWAEWLGTHREQYLQRMAARDRQFQAALRHFESSRAQHAADVRAAEQAWGALEADERWKAAHCRMCPACGRVVEKLSGCDAMVCGEDYHGGQRQNGCGHRFNWNAAPAYVPDTGERREVQSFTEAPPEEAAEYRHMIVPAEGLAMTCDVCHEAIVGPMAQCIHCRDFRRCIKCQDPGTHPATHVSRMIMGN